MLVLDFACIFARTMGMRGLAATVRQYRLDYQASTLSKSPRMPDLSTSPTLLQILASAGSRQTASATTRVYTCGTLGAQEFTLYLPHTQSRLVYDMYQPSVQLSTNVWNYSHALPSPERSHSCCPSCISRRTRI